jgi:predicted adenine nucleotide alpha hydrolase (AANH) superfamily ATPase
MVWDFENPQPHDLRTHETAKSDSPISKERESHEEFCGCIFPIREIEGRLSSSGHEKKKILRADA